MMRTVALVAFIFTISACADESDDSKEFGENGIGLLNEQAHALRSERADEKAQEWAPMDKTFKGFTAPKDEKEDDKEDKELEQTPKELGFPTYDENGLPDLNLVQMAEEDWNPTGQTDLKDNVQAAHDQDKKNEMDEDHLDGEHVLSSAGIEGEDSEDTDPLSSDFGELNLVQAQGSSGDWVPKGQLGMKEQIDALKSTEKEDQLHSDGLTGSTMLSSVGMKGDKEDPLEFEFVQGMDSDSDWVPKSSLSHQVEQIKHDEHDQQLSDDGLKGTSVLGSVGMHDDSKDENGDSIELVQEWQPAPLIGGQPKVAAKSQKLDVSASDEDDDEFSSFSSDEEQDEEYDKLGEESMGTDILGAGNMEHMQKQENDSMEAVGALSLDDLKL